MSDNNILIVAKFVARPGKADALSTVLSACIVPSRAEAGNVHYELYRSVEDASVFLFHETWKNTAAIETHAAQPHFRQLLADSDALLQQPPEIHQIQR